MTFKLTEKELGFWHNDLTFSAEPGTFKVFVGGNSNATLSGEFELK
jgi:beta-glucosidase